MKKLCMRWRKLPRSACGAARFAKHVRNDKYARTTGNRCCAPCRRWQLLQLCAWLVLIMKKLCMRWRKLPRSACGAARFAKPVRNDKYARTTGDRCCAPSRRWQLLQLCAWLLLIMKKLCMRWRKLSRSACGAARFAKPVRNDKYARTIGNRCCALCRRWQLLQLCAWLVLIMKKLCMRWRKLPRSACGAARFAKHVRNDKYARTTGNRCCAPCRRWQLLQLCAWLVLIMKKLCMRWRKLPRSACGAARFAKHVRNDKYARTTRNRCCALCRRWQLLQLCAWLVLIMKKLCMRWRKLPRSACGAARFAKHVRNDKYARTTGNRCCKTLRLRCDETCTKLPRAWLVHDWRSCFAKHVRNDKYARTTGNRCCALCRRWQLLQLCAWLVLPS